MVIAVEVGLIYAVMALGVYLTFRILNFPDLTADGSFTLGGAVAAAMIVDGQSALLATLAGFGAGAAAGWVTGMLHTKGNINGLLAGILTMIGLYSINLRIMGKSNVPLLREDTLITPIREAGLLGTGASILLFAGGAIAIKLLIDWFLHTNQGLAAQATGDKEEMIRSFGVNTDRTKILILALSNGLIALCGALIAQYQGFADIGMGIGLILTGLASVILGQAIFGSRVIFISTLAVIFGAVLYRIVLTLALTVGFNPNDMKLISAILVIVALVLPRWGLLKRIPSLRQIRRSVSRSTTAGAIDAPAEDAAAAPAPESATKARVG